MSEFIGDCPPWKPFPCPEGECIPLNYVCDKNDDCPKTGYDEDERMCTASNLLKALSLAQFQLITSLYYSP